MNEALVSAIRERYTHIVSKIADAAFRSGRPAQAVKLIVVSKAQPLETIQAAATLGISRFGENYVEEAVQKIDSLREIAVEWHMIGHLQSRKAELVAVNFSMLHSLDGAKLAGRLDRFCGELNRKFPVLVEFNVSGEQSKFGLPAWDEQKWPELAKEIEAILTFPNLQVRGLMTMPPFFDDPEQSRPYFQKLRRLQEFLKMQFPAATWDELSMGTSADFISAIQEGATYVRIGQAILGPRIY